MEWRTAVTYLRYKGLRYKTSLFKRRGKDKECEVGESGERVQTWLAMPVPVAPFR